MFSLFNGIYESYLAPSQLNLLIVGPPNAGKSALLERLKVTEIPSKSNKSASRGRNVTYSNNTEDLTQTLHVAFVETGATAGLYRSSSTSITSENNNSKNNTLEEIHRRLVAAEAATSTYGNNTNVTKSPVAKPKQQQQQQQQQQPRRFRFNICPAPERYLKSAQNQDEDYEDGDDDDDQEEEQRMLLDSRDGRTVTNRSSLDQDSTILEDFLAEGRQHDSFSEPPRRVRCHSKEFDMDSLDLIDGRQPSLEDIPLNSTTRNTGTTPKSSSATASNTTTADQQLRSNSTRQPLSTIQGQQLLQSNAQEYHLKPNAKMLSLMKIRPTIGSNLAKLDMYGAKCHIFDVGGRLQDLWERYYDDCDAVIFCWKMGEDPEQPPPTNDDDDDDSDSEDETSSPQHIYKNQQTMLNDVRKAIPDDVPFLVFGHIFGNANTDVVDKMYSTDLLLPHYHNPMTGLCCGSAKTGAGVQSAMDWLIPLAKRQQKERLAARKQMEDKVL
ncbi:ADP-ribosylation factor family protein [Nitzschia inconspicua]|uniref:ADP-ribosylation factor family protein n=1 Tax=Nitzschia inconspicua TaxID=303405 RepID=A0A9K3LTT1_9STRA|nr:ADP-ribosylation factor family protein [Nitzschia inconspicua]KAG7367854.1 ADP-ribosylation factor family protein [Nitzschia inconspicua]